MALETKNIAKTQLQAEVASLKAVGYRFVTLSCVDLGDSFDLIYHFDRELQMTHLRITVLKGDTVPSISNIYFAALCIENEIKDFFGISFDGLILDFGGHFYLEEEVKRYPFCKVSVKEPQAAKEGN